MKLEAIVRDVIVKKYAYDASFLLLSVIWLQIHILSDFSSEMFFM